MCRENERDKAAAAPQPAQSGYERAWPGDLDKAEESSPDQARG